MTTLLLRMLTSIVTITLFLPVYAQDRVQRTMEVHRVSQLGLEIWTEQDPKWDTALTTDRGKMTLVAETPASHYPPAGMTWTVPGITFTDHEFSEGARGALAEAARRYGLSAKEIAGLASRSAIYGDLHGYETVFFAIADRTPVEVKVFFGHRAGRPAVAMQAFTLRGKLAHISEQIRRSWTHVRYLED